MKNYFHYNILLIVFSITFFCSGCSKDWLDIKSNKSYVVPKTAEDYQALLDYDPKMNQQYPYMPIVSDDNFYIPYSFYSTLQDVERNAYVWEKNFTQDIFDWNQLYEKIFYANSVLEGLVNIEENERRQPQWNNVKGAALFYRALANYWLAETFCMPYLAVNPELVDGIPLRLTSDPSASAPRVSLSKTYEQIFLDLQQADSLLNEIPLYKTRPSKRAAKALLARVSLQTGNYVAALQYANETIDLYNFLMDYNNVVPQAPRRTFQRFHEEVIFQAECLTGQIIFYPYYDIFIDSTLYASYDNNDLRKELFFYDMGQGRFSFRGSYTGLAGTSFNGLAVNEIYYIKAECEARAGDAEDAMNTLNSLLMTRWKTGTFIPKTAVDAQDALDQVLQERRKELLFCGLRWSDLRRLNVDPRYAVTLRRKFDNGQEYSLPPNDPRYALPIPLAEIRITGINQNTR